MATLSASFINAAVVPALLFVLSSASAASPGGGRARLNSLDAFLNDGLTERQSVGVRGSKCGLWLTFDALGVLGRLGEEDRRRLSTLLAAPARDTNRVIGQFRIYYDTSGINAPSLLDANHLPIAGTVEPYVDSVGRIFNDVWSFEIDSLGYDPCPLPVDNFYPIVISELGFGLYGLTYPDPPVRINPTGPPRFATYIEIENDFDAVYPPSRGIPGLKVTAAHEFHHAIQLGAYGTWDSDRYFYEITSVWMEDVVYGDVNDYLQYLSNDVRRSSHFAHPETRFTLYDGSMEYSRGIWGKFVEKRYSPDLMRSVWEQMKQIPSLPALEGAFRGADGSFREAFLEFGYWNSSTGPTADTVRYYTEGRQYPQVRTGPLLWFDGSDRSFVDSVQALSSSYQLVQVYDNPMLVIVSNINVQAAGLGTFNGFQYEMTSRVDGAYKRLSNGVSVRLVVADPAEWFTWESVPSVTPAVIAYPNPFVNRTGRSLKFRLPAIPLTPPILVVLTSSLHQIVSREIPVVISPNFEPRIEWDGIDDNGERAASGVYFFVITADGADFMGKFSLVRDE